MFSHITESRASFHLTVTWEDKCHNHKHAPFPSPCLELLLLSMTWYGMEYHFGQFGSAIPGVFPSPWLLFGRAEWETKKALVLFKQYSAITKSLVCYMLGKKDSSHNQGVTFIPAETLTTRTHSPFVVGGSSEPMGAPYWLHRHKHTRNANFFAYLAEL